MLNRVWKSLCQMAEREMENPYFQNLYRSL